MQGTLRYTVAGLLALCACGDLSRSLPDLSPAVQPGITASPDNAGDGSSTGTSTGGTSGGTSTGGTPPAPLPTTGLVDDFKDGNGTAEGWGTWKIYGGGPTNPTDERHSVSFTAPGFADNSGQLTYTADSGSYSYSQLAIVFDPNQNVHDNTALRFHMKGTGPGVVALYVITRLSSGDNGYATYGLTLGNTPNDWQQFDIKFTDFSASGSPPFSLADSMSPGNFQGFKWNVGKPSGNTMIQDKTLQLDDVTLHK